MSSNMLQFSSKNFFVKYGSYDTIEKKCYIDDISDIQTFFGKDNISRMSKRFKPIHKLLTRFKS